MNTDNIERYLNSFGKQVVNRAKGNLQKAKGGGTALEGSIRFEVVTDADGFSIQFFMSDYGTYVDKGVSGKTLTYLIARSIGRKGIKSLSFFQKPLGLGLKQFGGELLGNVKQDIIDTLNKTQVN
jgi:hypothetical protein